MELKKNKFCAVDLNYKGARLREREANMEEGEEEEEARLIIVRFLEQRQQQQQKEIS